jgi:hypothetical protein
MIGMPSDLARALAQVRPPSPPPSAAAPQRIIQVGQPSVESTSARPPATGTPASPASAHLPAPSRPAEASSPPVTNSSRASSSPPPLRTRTSLENTEPERDHTLSPTRAKTSAKPSSIVASAEAPTAPAPSGDKFLATRLVSSERGAFVSKAEPISLSTSFDPNASSDARVSMVKARPVKKWPALSLIGLAVVAFGGVIAVRAPGLLPAPIAGWLMRAPAAAPASVPPPSAAVPSTPSPSEVLPPMAADAPPTPTASPDAPAQGERAQLEKQAIDLLIANDYSAARAVYEKLHALEPARPEYSALLDLLARELAPTCGGPGQAPCGAP